MKEYRQNESQLKGVLNVFTDKIILKETLLKDSNYSYPEGLPNLGNTCYMNALLQALTGCPAFTAYIDRIWKHMKLDLDDSDSLVVFMLIKTLKELKNGSPDAAENANELHKMLCNGADDEDFKVFTRLFEQQDSHDLMFYLLEKITSITAKFSRQTD